MLRLSRRITQVSFQDVSFGQCKDRRYERSVFRTVLLIDSRWSIALLRFLFAVDLTVCTSLLRQQVKGMPYDDVLALIKQSRPAGPTELAFSRPALETGDDEL